MKTKMEFAELFVEIELEDGRTIGVTANLGELAEEMTYEEVINKISINDFLSLLNTTELFEVKSASYISKSEYKKIYHHKAEEN